MDVELWVLESGKKSDFTQILFVSFAKAFFQLQYVGQVGADQISRVRALDGQFHPDVVQLVVALEGDVVPEGVGNFKGLVEITKNFRVVRFFVDGVSLCEEFFNLATISNTRYNIVGKLFQNGIIFLAELFRYFCILVYIYLNKYVFSNFLPWFDQTDKSK